MDSKEELVIPDEALSYIVRNYLTQQHTEGLSVSIGVSHNVVQSVLDLFIAWAQETKRVKNNSIILGE